MKGCYVFVYGTLRYNFPLNFLLRDSIYVGLGYLIGYRMVDLIEYPGIIKGNPNDVVWGEAYIVSAKVLNILDEVEEYHNSPEDLYKREVVRVFFDSERKYELNAFAYIYNKRDFFTLIDVNDYTEYKNKSALINIFDNSNKFLKYFDLNKCKIIDVKKVMSLSKDTTSSTSGFLYKVEVDPEIYRNIKKFILLDNTSLYKFYITEAIDKEGNRYFAISLY